MTAVGPGSKLSARALRSCDGVINAARRREANANSKLTDMGTCALTRQKAENVAKAILCLSGDCCEGLSSFRDDLFCYLILSTLK